MRRTVIHETYYEIPENASPQARWILNLLNNYELTMSSLAKLIHVSRMAVLDWVNDATHISFGNICAVCYAVDKNADPERLYKLFNESRN